MKWEFVGKNIFGCLGEQVEQKNLPLHFGIRGGKNILSHLNKQEITILSEFHLMKWEFVGKNISG